MRTVLENPTDLEHVRKYTTDDFMYVSLNYENPELKQIMPWAGTTAGTEGLVQTFKDVFTFWSVVAFELQDSFENPDGAAIFGYFTYRSTTLEKTVTSPLSILARAKDGKLNFVQFMEDTFATVRSFRESGAYRIKANPDGSELDV
ncbi:nuclear transport factor 2 family protein [Pseudoxanthomonas sp. PXM02]|nr:nuclear transport factor 2 family protein [Pseudoxanthomonas sp. PXM02]